MHHTVTVVGRGNVGIHLAKAFNVEAVNSRTLEGLPEYSDVIIIAVKDDAIAEVASRLKGKCGILCHTSGSIPIDVLTGCAPHIGVLYPMQTFSKNVELDYSSIPFFAEASDSDTEKCLAALASTVSDKVCHADSAGRKRLHIAAVFACNFANHLVAIADSLLHEDGLDYRVLLPLLHQTVDKLDRVSPHEAQTGPASRHDLGVINSHLSMLSRHPDYQRLYRLLSDSIINLT